MTIDTSIVLIVAVAVTFQLIVSTYPYSGFKKSPMFGDFEAHRHWIEITTNLPISQWYSNSSDNDMNYWGIDYPPLAAYQSWVAGRVTRPFNVSWFILNHSRGLESLNLKVFMRTLVIMSWAITVLPGSLLTSRAPTGKINTFTLSCLLLNPVMLMIDNGHFQFNCVPIGLSLLASWCLKNERLVAGTVFYTFALMYKQMAAYFLLPIVTLCLIQCSAIFFAYIYYQVN